MTEPIDPDLIIEVEREVNSFLRRNRYPSFPGRGWVKRQIKNAARQSWWDTEDKQLNIEDIQENALKWAKREGLEPAVQEEEPTPKELVATGVGQAYAAAQGILPQVKEIRKQLWDKISAPFPQTEKGHKEALNWLHRVKQEDETALGDRQPGRVTVSITLETDKPEQLQFKPLKLTSVTAELKITHNPAVTALTDILSQVDHKVLRWRTQGGYSGNSPFPRLLIEAPNGRQTSLRVIEHTRLAKLSHAISKMTALTQWWSEAEALSFILFGKLPAPGILTHYRGPIGSLGVTPKITLELRGPATVNEVQEAYVKILEKHKLHPKTLSKTQEAVLRLVHETPDLTWRQRYRMWLDWIAGGQDLPPYGYIEKSGIPSLYNEYKRAVERAGWGRSQVAKDAYSITAGEIGRSLSDDEVEKRMKEIQDKLRAKRK